MTGLLTDQDYAEMRQDMLDVRSDNEQAIILRRNNIAQPSQTVRIARYGGSRASEKDSQAATEVRGNLVIMGDIDFDVEIGDEFNDTQTGELCRVSFVRPNRRIMVVAEAEVIG